MNRWSFSAQRMDSVPPGRFTLLSRPVSPWLAAAVSVAHAPVPQASVEPSPRSQTRTSISPSRTRQNSMFAFAGKTGWLSSAGPRRRNSSSSG